MGDEGWGGGGGGLFFSTDPKCLCYKQDVAMSDMYDEVRSSMYL